MERRLNARNSFTIYKIILRLYFCKKVYDLSFTKHVEYNLKLCKFPR